jgi:hypothetical protein
VSPLTKPAAVSITTSDPPQTLDCPPPTSRDVPTIIRVTAAWLCGILAALAGALAYAVILRRYSNFDFSIVTVPIGFMVGRAVRTGAGNRTSRAYQTLAVFLTYGAIAGAYIAVRAAFLFYDGHSLSLAQLRPLHLVVEPMVQAAQDWLLRLIYILALIVAWCACGRGGRSGRTPVPMMTPDEA